MFSDFSIAAFFGISFSMLHIGIDLRRVAFLGELFFVSFDSPSSRPSTGLHDDVNSVLSYSAHISACEKCLHRALAMDLLNVARFWSTLNTISYSVGLQLVVLVRNAGAVHVRNVAGRCPVHLHMPFVGLPRSRRQKIKYPYDGEPRPRDLPRSNLS